MTAARRAADAGFHFVDVKHCHGYLGHELLSARDRAGPLRRQLREPDAVPARDRGGDPGRGAGPRVAVRLSAFDTFPYRKGAEWRRRARDAPRAIAPRSAFSRRAMPEALDDARVPPLLESLGIRWVCVTAGSPYYNPHVQRPALFPPSDGYLPPEDPLRGVARQIEATARLKAAFPELVFVGSAYSYLQEWLPHVAERVVRDGRADFVGLGRMVLSYPDLPADVLAGRPLEAQGDLPHLQRLHDRARETVSSRAATRSTPSTRAAPRRPAQDREGARAHERQPRSRAWRSPPPS